MRKVVTREEVRLACAMTLRTFRGKMGLAQETLALEAGVSRGYMGQLERGETTPTIETVCRLAPYLEVSVVAFFEEFERSLARVRRQAREARSVSPEQH